MQSTRIINTRERVDVNANKIEEAIKTMKIEIQNRQKGHSLTKITIMSHQLQSYQTLFSLFV